MASPIARRPGFRALLLLAATPVFVSAVDPALCGSFNTGTTPEFRDDFQTNGLCFDRCKADYAYAITQLNSCWCSDFAPSEDTQVSLGRCNTPCPAYPAENCGGRGLFGYVELPGKLPEGTRGPNDDEASSTTAGDNDSTSTAETDEPQSTTRMQTLTTDGVVRTVTVIPEVTNGGDGSDSDGNADQGRQNGGGLGTGAVVGIVVGVIAAVLIAAGAILFWFFKRRKRNEQNDFTEDPSVRGNSSDRVASSHPEMSMGAAVLSGAGSNSPTSTSNRNSMLAIDPRMDPFKQGLYMRNGSHESINTLRDDHDYSRRIQSPKVLRATNPDPDS